MQILRLAVARGTVTGTETLRLWFAIAGMIALLAMTKFISCVWRSLRHLPTIDGTEDREK
jgi:hypothetical protein